MLILSAITIFYFNVPRNVSALLKYLAAQYTMELSMPYISDQAFSTVPVHCLAGQGCVPQR